MQHWRAAGQVVGVRVKKIRTNGSTESDGLYYMYTDHLGNVGALSDENGSYISGSLTLFRPFGDFRREPSTNPSVTDRGYTGHVHNNTGSNDLGLIYMRARFYLPEAGRFISADTLVPDPMNPQQFNRYTYSLNSPIKFLDSTGHCATDPYDEYDDYACWQQYNYLVDYLTERGYDFWEYLGGGAQWEYIPEVFNVERLKVLPLVHKDMLDNVTRTYLEDFEGFSQGYHFYSIYHKRSGTAFAHKFLNEYRIPPEHNSPLSFAIAETYSQYILKEPRFLPYTEGDFDLAFNAIKYGYPGDEDGANNLKLQYGVSNNPVGASSGVDSVDKAGSIAPWTLAIDLQTDLTDVYLDAYFGDKN